MVEEKEQKQQGKEEKSEGPWRQENMDTAPAQADAQARRGESDIPITDIKKTEEYLQLNDKYLRLAAEFENYKKRSAREYSRLIEAAEAGLISEELEVIDDLERGLAHEAQTLDSLRQGVEMILGKLNEILKRRGLREMKTIGEHFDPLYHEAVMQTHTDQAEEGIIVAEIQKGYFLNDTVLRPARVVVAAKPEPQRHSAQENGGATRDPTNG